MAVNHCQCEVKAIKSFRIELFGIWKAIRLEGILDPSALKMEIC